MGETILFLPAWYGRKGRQEFEKTD